MRWAMLQTVNWVILPNGMMQNTLQLIMPQVCHITCSAILPALTLCVYSDPSFKKNLNQMSLTPRWPLTPSLLGSHVWLCQRIIMSKSHGNTSKYVNTVTFFFKNLNQRSLTPRWPLTSRLLRSHVWLYPMLIVSKSHGNTSMYVDTVINFTKY